MSRCDQARCLSMFVRCPCGHDTKVAVASLSDAAKRSPRSPSYSPAIKPLSTRRTPSNSTLPLPTFTPAVRFLAGAVMSLKENDAPRVSDPSTPTLSRGSPTAPGFSPFLATDLAYLIFSSLSPFRAGWGPYQTRARRTTPCTFDPFGIMAGRTTTHRRQATRQTRASRLNASREFLCPLRDDVCVFDESDASCMRYWTVVV